MPNFNVYALIFKYFSGFPLVKNQANQLNMKKNYDINIFDYEE